jgi:hypothetical protein
MECRTPESLMNNPPRRIGVPALKVFATFVAACAISPAAHASGGNYVIQGGTPYEQSQVHQALDASSFNWNLVTQQILIDIDPTITRDQSIPGEIFLNPDLLNAGELSWGVVQNEYAHQVDLYLLTPAQDALFNTALGGTAWCYSDQLGLQLAQYGCERFASTLAWAYWQSPQNCIQPAYVGVVAAGMSPAAFRAFLTAQLGTPTTTSFHGTRHETRRP